MTTQKVTQAHLLANAALVISICIFLILLMMFAIMSSNFYTIFYTIFGGEIGESMIRGIQWIGVFLTFPVGVFNIITGFWAQKQGMGGADKHNSRIAIASIVIGALNTLLGGAVLIFFLFFVTF